MTPSNLVFKVAIQLTSQLFNLTIKYLKLLEIICIRRTCLLTFQAALRVVGHMVLPTVADGVFGVAWSLCGMEHKGKSLIFVLQEFSASIDKAFILAGGLGAGLSFCGVWTLSSYFLIS